MKHLKLLLAAICALLISGNAMADDDQANYVLFHYNGTVSGDFYYGLYYSNWTKYSEGNTLTNGLPSDLYESTATAIAEIDSESSDWYYVQIPTELTAVGGYALVYTSSWAWQTDNVVFGLTSDVYIYGYTATSKSNSYTNVATADNSHEYNKSEHTIYLDGEFCNWSSYTNYAFTMVSLEEYTLTIDLESDDYTTSIYDSTNGSSALKFVIDGGWWGLVDAYNITADADSVEISTSGNNTYLESPTGSQVTIRITVGSDNFYVEYTNVDDGSTDVLLSCANLQTDETSSDWGTAEFTAETDEEGNTYYTLTTDVTNLYDESEGYLPFKIVVDDNWYGLADADGESVYNISCEAATALGSENNIYLDTNVDITSTSTLTLTVTLVDEVYYLTVSGGCTNTAIEAIAVEAADAPMPVYSISGAYITTVSGLGDAALKALPKGLYIVGGQRYLAK